MKMKFLCNCVATVIAILTIIGVLYVASLINMNVLIALFSAIVIGMLAAGIINILFKTIAEDENLREMQRDIRG